MGSVWHYFIDKERETQGQKLAKVTVSRGDSDMGFLSWELHLFSPVIQKAPNIIRLPFSHTIDLLSHLLFWREVYLYHPSMYGIDVLHLLVLRHIGASYVPHPCSEDKG